MKQTVDSTNHDRKEERDNAYKTAVRDARHIFSTYKVAHPDEAWECLRKILFNPKLK